MSPKTLAVIRRIYDEVHAGLWALLVAGVLYFLMTVLPQLPARQAQAQRLRDQQYATENRYYCEKWGIPAGTRRHLQCTLDLQQLRAKIAQEMEDEPSF
jgi:hypothetical protein